ncbi:glycosyltransferase family 2 protein [Mesoflavibacter zeaxanthinifaciens]|uniref:glycosyltransferase family 2 protein n=1 Tax=Mesoflavibacter zeaxanthinifaciens TaxID=393060 RepID=UPI0026EFC289|nr:glycosyltransferase family 2 protein [Mesoflavibacter zeaxanthinifaciens]
MVKISGVVITYNEEKHIEALIKNLDFVDEILFIDSFSTDNITKILENYPSVNFIQHRFKNFASQRNFAISKACGEWILFLDADERISTELRNEILTIINKPSKPVAYKIPRKFYINNKPINFSGLQTDYIFRLFKKGEAFYDENKYVHEQLNFSGDFGLLNAYIKHYTYKNFSDYKNKTIFYANLKAKELVDSKKQFSYFKLILKPLYKFFYNYIFRLGFLDGKQGFIICYLNAYGVYIRYKKLKDLTS